MSVLMNKLPGDLRLIVGRKIGEADWQLDTIMTELRQEIEAREQANPLAASNQNDQKRSGEKSPPTAATLLLGEQPPCCYCNNSHNPERCDQVCNPEERKQALMKSSRCFVCLRKGHFGLQCRLKLHCVACGGKHHPLICAKISPREKEPAAQTEPLVAGLNLAASPFQPPHDHVNTLSQCKGTSVAANSKSEVIQF